MISGNLSISILQYHEHFNMPFLQITGSHLVQCHLQMECTDTSLAYFYYVPENKFAAYFPVAKNHVLSEIMLELLVHMYEKKPLAHPWAHFEHATLVQLGKKLEGPVPTFESTQHFRSWVNSQAKLIRPVSFLKISSTVHPKE